MQFCVFLPTQHLSATTMVMAKMTGLLGFLVALVMVVSSGAQAARCSPQFPLSCASYVLDGRAVPLKTCCIELQDNFKILDPKASLKPYCDAIVGVKLFNGPLAGNELNLALNLPNKCVLSGQYKKGQTCAGKWPTLHFLCPLHPLLQSPQCRCCLQLFATTEPHLMVTTET